MSTPLTSLLPQVRRGAKNCPEPTQLDAILRASRQICRETWFVKRTLFTQTETNVGLYPMPDVEGDEEIIAIQSMSITIPPGNVWPVYPQVAGSMNPNQTTGVPRGFNFVQPSEFSLSPLPQQSYPLQITVVIQPTATATTIPDEIYKKYDREIGYGALAWIMEMPGENWSNANLALWYAKKFSSAINNIKADALRQSLPGNPRVQPRRFII